MMSISRHCSNDLLNYDVLYWVKNNIGIQTAMHIHRSQTTFKSTNIC